MSLHGFCQFCFGCFKISQLTAPNSGFSWEHCVDRIEDFYLFGSIKDCEFFCPLSLFPCFFFLTMTFTPGAWNHGPLISTKSQAAQFAPWKHPAVWTKGMRGKRTSAAWCHCTLVVKTTGEMASRKNTFLMSCCSSYGLVDKSLLVAVMPSTTNDSDAYWFESYCNRGNCWPGCVTLPAPLAASKKSSHILGAKPHRVVITKLEAVN